MQLTIPFRETQRAYLVTTEQMLKRYARTQGATQVITKDDLPGFAEWLVTVIRAQVDPNSWRTYRYQLTQAIGDSEFYDMINVPPLRKKRDISKAEKGNYRTRHLKDNVLSQLDAYLKRSKSRYAEPLRRTLILSTLTGLRPSEWGECQLRSYSEDNYYLQVESAKKGVSEQKLQDKRYIPLDHLNSFEFDLLTEHLSFLSENKPYAAIHDGIAQFMRQVTRTLFYQHKDRPTLYSARHQFAANLKSSGISAEVIAAVMGHIDTSMQTKYYGRTSSGHPVIFNESLARILNRLD